MKLPLIYLAVAALIPISVGQPSVEHVVTVALVLILFDGGRGMGLVRFRAVAPTVLCLGLLGTVVTVAGAAVVGHLVLGVSWYLAVLLATALAPTDPAVVFSVLGSVEGRSATVLEGESGANDPVGIALMVALLDAGSLSGQALSDAAVAFALQLVVGSAVGIAGGFALRRASRLVALPGAFGLFALAAVAHGSGLLAVFVAGIVVGGDRIHVAVGTVGEAAAFLSLGLLVDPRVLVHLDVWLPGLLLFLAVAALVRPLACWPLLLPARLSRAEQAFVLLAGLKGAVPLLLGSMLLDVDQGQRLYGVTVVVVVLSVLVQGTLTPVLARRT
ncbi:MAG: cvrA [Frankiales bacterium]|nr:cvrA [Frankiales bacterium]